MIIEKLEIREFGKFKDQIIDFNEEINCITGDNETGKTTIALFIRYMLYGIPKERRKDDFSLRDRIIPFNSNCARGAMIIKKDGRTYRLERYFGKNIKDDTKFLFDDVTKEKIIISTEPGEYFLNLKEESFIRLLMVQELNQKINVDGSEEIFEKLQNFAITMDERVNSQHAIKLIEEKIKNINNLKNTGDLDILEGRNTYILNRLKEIEEAKLNLKSLNIVLENKLNEVKSIEDDKSILLKSRDDQNKLRSIENYEEALILLNKKQELEEKQSSYLSLEEYDELEDLLVILKKLNIDIGELTNSIKEYNIKYSKYNEDNDIIESIDDTSLNNEKGNELSNLISSYKEQNRKLELLSFSNNDIEKDSKDIKHSNGNTSNNTYDNKINYTNQIGGLNSENIDLTDLDDNSNFDIESDISNLSQKYMNSLKRINRFKNHKIEIIALIIIVILTCAYFITDSMELLLIALAPLIFILVFGGYKFYQLKEEKNKSLQLLTELRRKTNNSNGDEFIELLSFLNEEGFNVRRNDIKEKINSLSAEIRKIINDSNSKDIDDFYNKLGKINEINEEKAELEKYLLNNSSKLSNEKDRIIHAIKEKEDDISKYLNIKNNLEDLNTVNSTNGTNGINGGITEVNIRTLGKVVDKLEDIINRKNEFLSLDDEYNKVFNKLSDLSDEVNLNQIILEPIKYTKDEISKEILKEKEYTDKIEGFNKVINLKKQEMNGIYEKLKVSENVILDEVKLVTELSENNLKIKELKSDLLSLYMARENITEIISKMKREYLPKVSAKLSEIMNEFSNGKYDKVNFKDDFSISFEKAGFTKDFRYLSRGTVDILWVALRLALCDIILSGEKMPIILDDTFIHLDNGRLKNALDYLKNKQDKYQIIILSCHKREEDILNNI